MPFKSQHIKVVEGLNLYLRKEKRIKVSFMIILVLCSDNLCNIDSHKITSNLSPIKKKKSN